MHQFNRLPTQYNLHNPKSQNKQNIIFKNSPLSPGASNQTESEAHTQENLLPLHYQQEHGYLHTCMYTFHCTNKKAVHTLPSISCRTNASFQYWGVWGESDCPVALENEQGVANEIFYRIGSLPQNEEFLMWIREAAMQHPTVNCTEIWSNGMEEQGKDNASLKEEK